MIPTGFHNSAQNLTEVLADILKEDPKAAIHREQTAFDEMATPFSRSLVLFGAGGLGRKTLAGLRKIGIKPLGFTDNNPDLWGKIVDGLRVFSPEEAAMQWKDQAAFIITVWRHGSNDRMDDRIKQFQKLGCQVVVPFIYLFWKYPDVFLPHYLINLPSKVIESRPLIKEVYSLFADEPSRQEFVAQLRFRYLGDFNGLQNPVNHEEYFPDDLWRINSTTVFIDCGAYSGDTIQAFLRRSGTDFSKIIAIEPDPHNYSQLDNYLSALPDSQREKITAYKLAIGSQQEQVRFNAQGTVSSSMGNGSEIVDCVPIDDLMSNDFVPTIIKMDIEGGEPNALIGARKTISMYRPNLAICSYHRQDHLWQIPLLIHSISDSYKLYLRPHQLEGWDLVCYAVPD